VDDRFWYAHLKQVRKLWSGQGPAEEVALPFRTVVGLKECELHLRFDTVGNYALLKGFCPCQLWRLRWESHWDRQ